MCLLCQNNHLLKAKIPSTLKLPLENYVHLVHFSAKSKMVTIFRTLTPVPMKIFVPSLPTESSRVPRVYSPLPMPVNYAISISYRMVLSAIWDIFFEFFLFPTYCTSRRRVQYRKQNEREKYIPYCTKLPCDNWFIVR